MAVEARDVLTQALADSPKIHVLRGTVMTLLTRVGSSPQVVPGLNGLGPAQKTLKLTLEVGCWI